MSRPSRPPGPLTRRALLGRAAAVAAVAGCRKPEAPGPEVEAPFPELRGDTSVVPTDPDTGGRYKAPNIVYIYLDQLRGTAWGAAGDPAAITPNLDGLAASSVRFARAYTNAPLCRPARAVMLTGRYPHQTGIVHNTTVPPTDTPSHVRRLRDEAGYHTMLIGKFHLYESDDHTDEHRSTLEEFGFSDSVELLGQTEQSERRSPYSDWLTSSTPSGETDKYERYIDYTAKYTWTSPPPDAAPWRLTTEDHLDQYCARRAVGWLREYDSDKPFYLQLNFPGPHKPFNATSEFRAMYDLATTPFPEPILEAPVDPSPIVTQYLGIKYEEWTADSARELALSYYATITLVDHAIGQVLAELEALGRLDDTWIVFGGDHGELLCDHMMTGKVVFYEGSVRQALLLRPPGGTDPWTCDALVDQTDVTSTVLAIAGLGNEVDQPGIPLTGKVVAGPVAPDAHEHRAEIFGGNLGYWFIRDGRWKAGFDADARRITELFDLDADPDERVNLRLDPVHEELRRELVVRFEAYFAEWPVVGTVVDGPGDTG